ncbi:hypothetical protein EJB05_00991, partial [Eragrostis curvula]
MAPSTSTEFKFLVCLAAASGLFTVIHGQLDSRPGRALMLFLLRSDFISIDCGIGANQSYTSDFSPRLRYVSDAGFTDAGLTARVKPPYEQYDDPNFGARFRTVRYFPEATAGERSCYTLWSVTPGGKYLVRASFYYGNYDGLNRPPAFDLYIGVNQWATVNITAADYRYILEAVAVLPANFLQVSDVT